ncbi:ATP-binding protein [Bradyrhizobium sp. UFLA03-84]|uniref:DNA-packaging protein n=1 Tax=Bradyrhizobium sp. UFLA03-84 TaxID=418599 RepID=UPI000BAE44E7|nr:terminase family protein [Bradyrhizobium sp. UFLA03-84]PAY05450.1 ATP-binding protein [Bradyrhizobium sp. UFLA03-84]
MQPNSPTIYGQLAAALQNNWRLTARPEQLPPPGDWNGWLLMAGRGFGKTRTGAEWVRECVEAKLARHIALVAPTAADARDVMVEGPAGLLAVSSPWCRPTYEPSKRRLTWPNGAIASTFSSEEADRLRGPQHDLAWCDELGAWNSASAAWDMLMFGLRLGRHPRWLVTTTPKPIKLLRELLARQDVVTVRGSTFDNSANLAGPFLEAIRKRYEGTRLGRQELNAELLNDVPGALWQLEWLDRDRVSKAPEDLCRIVVAVDPAVSNNEGSDETGIVVAALGQNGDGYVLADLSGRCAPHEWAAKAVTAYRQFKADRIVIEANQGGAMAEETLRVQDRNASIKKVHASRGKVTRAEPVSALYEQRKVHHVGTFTALEDQLTSFTSDFDRSSAGFSPDRLDALVWALTELMVGAPEPARFIKVNYMGR